MSALNSSQMTFSAPGPGCWEVDSTHIPRPFTVFVREAWMKAFPKGFSESTARYGSLLDHLKPAEVNGFIYQQPVAFGAPPGAKGPPPKLIFMLMTRLLPKMRHRIRTSHLAFENKTWRDHLREWDEVIKPDNIKKHKALQAIDPTELSQDELIGYIGACRLHLEEMVKRHHQFTATCIIPIGDFLAHTCEWTGEPVHNLLQLLRGSSKISVGVAVKELEALAVAIRTDSAAMKQLTKDRPSADILELLKGMSEPVSTSLKSYLDIVGHRSLGYDICDHYALEFPDILVKSIRVAVEGRFETREKANLEQRINRLRQSIPEKHRNLFDELLAEARLMNRLRDERGVYSDSWALGLARRAMLCAGKRLKKQGVLDESELAIDASNEEIVSLLRGQPGVSQEVLRNRAKYRTEATVADVPQWLGGQPAGPPPIEWLPRQGRRTERAFNAFISALFGEPEMKATDSSIKGLPASPGVYIGKARLVLDSLDFGRIEPGDVLVTRSTSATFNAVLPLLGALITDRGGQLSHAAIVAREYGIPGVVGTKLATRILKDDVRVRVDGDAGQVTTVS